MFKLVEHSVFQNIRFLNRTVFELLETGRPEFAVPMYDGFMNRSAKNLILGWICLLMGMLPILFMITSCCIGLNTNNASSVVPLFLMFVFACICAGFVGLCMALYFWRQGPIQLFGKISRTPLWISAAVATVLSITAGMAYQFVTPTGNPTEHPAEWQCRLPADR